MECPNCRLANREGAVYCLECGTELEIKCPHCKKSLPPRAKFCDACGQDLKQLQKSERRISEPDPAEETSPPKPIESERKHVTTLFSDLSGYTTMSERLDPEEVKEITGKIFDEVSKIINKYEGFVEKFAGDAVMALFGATEAHEDDPVRAIKAAREIHNLVNSISPQYEERIEQPLAMHTGINTGLVVTGEVDLEKGTHGVAGDTINVAARLSSLGMANDILVGPDTFYQSQGYFDFKELEPATLKGKTKPIRIYKVLSQKDQPIKFHRLHGFQAELIGRKVEMNHLSEAVLKLKEGRGAVFSIYGPAGTGKSRLIQEFKNALNLDEIQWLEGHAYPHSQNIPYFPLIDLLNRSLRIEEGDPPDRVKEKIETGISSLVGENTNFIPYIGSLYSISYPQIDEVSPAFWKEQLQKAIQTILSALARQAPTIIRLEDLHWADPSFLEMIRLLLSESRDPILFLCVYRPMISLFTTHQVNAMAHPYQEIRLQDFSASESQGMVESLLKTTTIPIELQRFLQDKVEGNPFYIEEVINSLIESETLIRDNGSWKLTRAITESEISSTIHGVISGRLDRLEKESKRILQEASVIGRTFFYEILNRVTEMKQQIDQSLRSLERLDLIRARAMQPDLEYIFKHALTQEVVYNGLLKKERRVIHERIGLVMEQLFQDRLPEFYETLSYHFKQGQSALKAVTYLMKAGEKSLRRYAVEEAHQYYQEAYDLILNKTDKTREDERLLIDVVLEWSMVFYYRADCKSWEKLFSDHRVLAEAANDKERLGMFYAWLGLCLFFREKFADSYTYLRKAFKIGKELENQKIIGYACAWLSWTCAELGLCDEAIARGQRAQEIAADLKSDQYLYFKSLAALAHTYIYKGDSKKALEIGQALLEYGQKHSNLRSVFMGYSYIGYSNFITGDLPSAIEYSQKAIQVSVDPLYSTTGKLLLGFSHAFCGNFQEIEDLTKQTQRFCQDAGCGAWGAMAEILLGITTISSGQMSKGLEMLRAVRDSYQKNGRKGQLALPEYLLGKIYLQIVEGKNLPNFFTLARNIGFMAKNVPAADKKAEGHFKRAIEITKEIGSMNYMARAYFDLGRLHKAKKRIDQARECISKAIELFEQCEADVLLQEAKEALASLE
ncbi:MAG: AAA family ATPase [Desulfobacterales bacterium]|jgi:class 3 adenylate cyclase/tetratricopeptide (TPR) repeat protein